MVYDDLKRPREDEKNSCDSPDKNEREQPKAGNAVKVPIEAFPVRSEVNLQAAAFNGGVRRKTSGRRVEAVFAIERSVRTRRGPGALVGVGNNMLAARRSRRVKRIAFEGTSSAGWHAYINNVIGLAFIGWLISVGISNDARKAEKEANRVMSP